jgi:uncharacterized protein YuzE
VKFRVDASYLRLRHGDSLRTLTIRPDLLVDVDESGHVVGIERIGGQVNFEDLRAILAHVQVNAVPLEA